jgi:hypothetical protein
MNKRKNRLHHVRAIASPAKKEAASESIGDADEVLQNIGAIIYRTDEAGNFHQPSPAPIEFFLGPGKSAGDLKKAQDFYVIAEQRAAFLARLKSSPGTPINDYVLLKLPVACDQFIEKVKTMLGGSPSAQLEREVQFKTQQREALNERVSKPAATIGST